MKRQDIISKLMNEGFTQKTLVNLTDKHLHMLAERILSEQYTTNPSIINIPKEKTQDIIAAKNKKQTFATYESEVKEELKGSSKKKEKSEEELVLQRITHKIKTKMKDDECIKNEIALLKKMKKDIPEKYLEYIEKRKEKTLEKEIAEQTPLQKASTTIVDTGSEIGGKIKKGIEDFAKSKTGQAVDKFGKSYIPAYARATALKRQAKNEPSKESDPALLKKVTKVQNKITDFKHKYDPVHTTSDALIKKLKSVNETKNIKKWVNKLVETKFLTSKSEILGLIETKLNEQKVEPKPGRPEVEPDIAEPTIAPDNDPDTDNPFKVQPGIKIAPKAKSEISPEDAKIKIIDLMKKTI